MASKTKGSRESNAPAMRVTNATRSATPATITPIRFSSSPLQLCVGNHFPTPPPAPSLLPSLPLSLARSPCLVPPPLAPSLPLSLLWR